MRFAELVETYERLEATTKRLEMRTVLVALFQSVPRSELAEVVCLSQGQLRPEYEGVELGMAVSLGTRAVAEATGATVERVGERLRALGDLGDVVQELLQERGGAPPEPIGVRDVYGNL
ncbi:MAG: DNA ligase, partial [Thermoplasmata archaeon]|nr:DNA ligase [Thermoplasmata archaeon]